VIRVIIHDGEGGIGKKKKKTGNNRYDLTLTVDFRRD
jgi:hypothetical protein